MAQKKNKNNPLLELVKKKVAYLGIDEKEARSRLIEKAGLARSVVWRFWDGSRVNMDNLYTILNYFDLIGEAHEGLRAETDNKDLIIFKKKDLPADFRFLESLAPAIEQHNKGLCEAILKASVDVLYKRSSNNHLSRKTKDWA
jgi:hypothetical protein